MNRTQVDFLIVNGSVLTMNDASEIFDDAAIAINGDTIVALGPTAQVTAHYEARETLDASNMVIIPGLIDTHFHTGQQLERGIFYYLSKEMKLREPIWKNYLIPFEASLSDEDVLLSARFAYANLLKVGTTCFADAGGPKPECMAPAVEETGIRGVLVRSTLDHADGIPMEMQDTPAEAVAKGERLYRTWHGRCGGRIRVWLGMRQIMVCSREMLESVRDLAARLGTGIHIHLAEGPYEVDYAVEQSGLRPAEYLAALGFLNSNVLAAHSVLLSNHELDLYQEHDVAVAHCPAIMFRYTGVAKVPEMLRRGLRVGLGTDGALSSGGSLDLFRQMHIALHTLTAVYGLPYRDHAPVLPDDLLAMATRGGARALGWEAEIGSLSVGKKADMVLLARDDLDVLPSYDPTFAAVSNAAAAQVRTVIVNGQVVVKNGALVLVDEEELRAKVKERAPLILARFLEKL